MEEIIKVENLKKYFRDVKAVDGISFGVESGELFGFLGINGAGKSTTINILCTLLKETSGSISICELDTKTHSKDIRSKIGVVFQDNTLDDYLTIKENLILRGALYDNNSKRIKENIDRVAEILDIKDLLSRQFRKLSGGQKRRCEIAKSLMNEPEILFLDEPTTGLDPQTRIHVWDTIEQLRVKNGMTVFLTTHYMEEAARAKHICIMDAGKIIARGTPAVLKEKYAMDVLKVYTLEIDKIKGAADKNGIKYKVMSNCIAFSLNHTKQALEILNTIPDCYDSFEVIQGNMDDVFINATGKKLVE